MNLFLSFITNLAWSTILVCVLAFVGYRGKEGKDSEMAVAFVLIFIAASWLIAYYTQPAVVCLYH